MAKRIEFKAYGGTGTLVGRCFLTLLALNAGDLATAEHKDDKCVIYQLDYDDIVPVGGANSDGAYFSNIIESYRKLHERGLKFLAPIAVEKHPLTLKSVRTKAYGKDEKKYSLESLFCSDRNRNEIRELLSSAFTTNPQSTTEEIERSNRDGCYGDLAVNGFISERLIVDQSFMAQKAYNDLETNLQDAIVFYAGSTDGGTANTMIDKDIESMLTYLQDRGKDIGHGRQFHVYGLRTTPYSKFKLQGSETDVKITKDILQDKFAMSRGVFQNIQRQNNAASNEDVHDYSYYYLNKGQRYWLDGLFVASSEKLDLTASEARKDNQFHPSHLVEFALAAQAMDAIANRLPNVSENTAHLYAYNDGADEKAGDIVQLNAFFGTAQVKYEFEILTANNIEGSIPLSKYIRAILLTLVTIKGQMIYDFANYQQEGAKYITDIFNGAHGDEDSVCPIVAEELKQFLEEVKFIVMALVEVMDFSKFEKSSRTVQFAEDALRYLYDRDNFNNAVATPAGASLSINTDNNFQIQLISTPTFSVVDEMSSIRFSAGNIFGGGKLKNEKAYLNKLQGTTTEQSARNIANNMIRRLFEVYLNYLNS